MGCLRLVDRWRYRLRLVHAEKAVTSKSTHKSGRSDSPYRLAISSKLDIRDRFTPLQTPVTGHSLIWVFG